MTEERKTFKVLYKTVLWGDEPYFSMRPSPDPEHVKRYSLLSAEYCCPKMEETFGEFVVFNSHDCGNTVAITHCNPYPEGSVWDTESISFCPFCGAKIEAVEAVRVKQTKKVRFIPSREEYEYEEKQVDSR